VRWATSVSWTPRTSATFRRPIKLLSKEAKIGAHGKPVVFLHPADMNGVLLELEKAN
jgi:hypothetical protein